jgi:uncharacterized protein
MPIVYNDFMELTKDNSQTSYQIQRYRTGFVTINHEEKSCPIIVLPEKIITWDLQIHTQNDTHVKLLNAEDLSIFVELHPDVVIIGTGEKNPLLPMEIFLPLIEAQIGFEVMSSAAACRTYSLLSLEGRNVALGLIF